MWNIHTMKYYLAIKWNEVLPWLVWLGGLSAARKPKVTGPIPTQGTCLGWQALCLVGGLQEAADQCISHVDVSLPLSPSLTPSL